ncbi:MAG: hypothetical protein IKE62_01165 [Oscillospiraceae bacterium]|nr:hypothetical protein [Oscillospiraceae bacterium]
MQKENQAIRERAKAEHVTLWQIAMKIGVSEPTLIRWMRLPLPEEKERRICDAISAIAEGGEKP